MSHHGAAMLFAAAEGLCVATLADTGSNIGFNVDTISPFGSVSPPTWQGYPLKWAWSTPGAGVAFTLNIDTGGVFLPNLITSVDVQCTDGVIRNYPVSGASSIIGLTSWTWTIGSFQRAWTSISPSPRWFRINK